MRTVELHLEGEELAALKDAMADKSGTENTLWSRDVELGENYVAELKVVGGGKDDDAWVDVVLFERGDDGVLSEVECLDVGETAFGEMTFPRIGVILSVTEPAPTPSM